MATDRHRKLMESFKRIHAQTTEMTPAEALQVLTDHAKLVDRLCDAVDNLADDIGDTDPVVFLQQLGPQVRQVQQALGVIDQQLKLVRPPIDMNNLDPLEDFLSDVMIELESARKKFPGDNVTTLALVEEVGELAKATFSESRDRVRKEAVQVAVMAIRVVLDGDSTLDEWRRLRALDPLVAQS